MKRFAALMMALACLLSTSMAAAAQEYTVAEKLVKQLWAGSGFSGVLTVETAAQEGKPGLETLKPFVLDVDYIYVRPTEEETEEHRVDLILMDGETARTSAHVQLKDEVLSLQTGLTGESWYALDAGKAEQGAALAQSVQSAAEYTGAPGLTQAACSLLAALVSAEDAAEWMIPYTTRIDIWMEGYRQEAVLGKTEDGTSTMQVSYAIPPAAIRSQVKQLVYDLLHDTAALTSLTDALGEETAHIYLNPALQDWYFKAIDALPLTGDLTLSRMVSLKGETLDLQVSLPLYDAQAGEVTLAYARTKGEGDLPDDHVIELRSAARSLKATYQEYSSMTGVQVMQGVLESTGADAFAVQEESAAKDWGVSFTLKLDESSSKDLENRDVYAFQASLSLAPAGEGEAVVPECEIELTSRFVSKELKSAATDMQATLTVSGENTVMQMTFEGASRKKWEPETISAARVSLSEMSEADKAALAAEAGVKALALLAEYAAMPE